MITKRLREILADMEVPAADALQSELETIDSQARAAVSKLKEDKDAAKLYVNMSRQELVNLCRKCDRQIKDALDCIEEAYKHGLSIKFVDMANEILPEGRKA